MKNNYKIICLSIMLLVQHFLYAQTKEIDSLEKLLHTNLSKNERFISQLKLADIYLEINPNETEKILQKININDFNDRVLKARYYMTKAAFEKDIGTILKALEYIKKAKKNIEFVPNSENNLLKCKIYYYYASMLNDNRNFKEAITYHLKALKQSKLIKNKQIECSIYSGLGNIYQHIQDYEKAKEYFLKSINIKEKNVEIDSHLASYYNGLGSCYEAEGKYNKSLFYLNKAIKININNKNTVSLITDYNNKANTLLLLKKYNQAIFFIKKAIHFADSLNLESQKTYPLSTYGEILFSQNKDNEAIKRIEKSNIISKKNKDFYLLSYNYYILYKNMLEKQNYKKALKYLNLKNRAKDSIFNIQKIKEINKLQIQYQTEKKNLEILRLKNKNKLKDLRLKKIHQKNKLIIVFTTLITMILFLLVVYGKNRIKTSKIISDNLKQKYEKELLNLELKALRTQMNPHFLFNCLNSINSFIIQNKTEIASEYLTKFSKLIRLVLSNSKKTTITLDKELETLELYIEMEKIRFDDDFEYLINIQKDVEPDFIEIPPLIIQPFVENSIWHGLLNKKDGTKRIIINILKKEDFLICSIIDNGIGRKAASEINNKKLKKHKSFGIDITQKRLHLVNKNPKKLSFIITTDLKDKDISIGTKVDIKIYMANF